ncbi:MAG: MFS transporter [Planctomycetota bacterium]
MSGSSSRWGLNPSTVSLLAVILLIAAGYELFRPFMPRYISKEDLEKNLLYVGLYGTFADLLEGIYYRMGGRIGARLGARRSLVLFCSMPIVGAAILITWSSTLAPFLALPLLQAWDSISAPSTLTVIGETLPPDRRTLALSMQSILKRIPRIPAYLVGGAMMKNLGDTMGVHVAAEVFMGLAGLALIVQLRFLKVEAKDAATTSAPFLATLRTFQRDLKVLLASDILIRLGEGFTRVLEVLYLTSALAVAQRIDPGQYGRYLALNAIVSTLIYIPIGLAASKTGTAKKPYIGLTFAFFALFPFAVIVGPEFGTIGLIAAFVVMGLREIGEPARKAMITELVSRERKTEETGLYWSARSFAVMIAPALGALAWLGLGPRAPFVIAGCIGTFGAVFFYATFGRQAATPAA